jgi:hypothetical protein
MVKEARYHGYSQVHFENAFALRVHKVAYYAFTSQHLESRHGNVATTEGNYRYIAPHHSREIGNPSLRNRILFATPRHSFHTRTPQFNKEIRTQGAGESWHGAA